MQKLATMIKESIKYDSTDRVTEKFIAESSQSCVFLKFQTETKRLVEVFSHSSISIEFPSGVQ